LSSLPIRLPAETWLSIRSQRRQRIDDHPTIVRKLDLQPTDQQRCARMPKIAIWVCDAIAV
jgi:hypothetical protein